MKTQFLHIKLLTGGLLLTLAAAAHAAEPMDLRQLSKGFVGTQAEAVYPQMRELQEGQTLPSYLRNDLVGLLGLDQATGFDVETIRHDERSNQTHLRIRQLHNGTPLWGHRMVITLDANDQIQRWHGSAVREVQEDVGVRRTGPSPQAAFLAAQQADRAEAAEAQGLSLQDSGRAFVYENESTQLKVYLDEDNKASYAYVVSFFRDLPDGGHPSRPTFILDAETGEIIERFDALTHQDMGTGPGGNEKTGLYHYGNEFGHLDITQSGNNCYMVNNNVRTINLDGDSSQPHVFNCFENDYKAINGAYSPINDAHFFGGVVYDMFMDWYDMPPLDFQLTMRVHYGNNFENAFWNGSSMTFGDGADRFYPLVDITVSAHEVAHGFTEQNSGLIYRNQSGALNEAFSDMAGEAAEYYLRGENNWQVGSDIFKEDGALRYLNDPPRDGVSIDSADDFRTGMDVHHSSGVFNKAFYLLATSEGWDTQMAFDVFVKANQDYWTPNSDYSTGGQAAVDAAADLGYPAGDLVAAFAAVDVHTEYDDGGDGGDGWLENGIPETGLTGAEGSESHFQIQVPEGAEDLSISISGGSGDADLYVRFDAQATTDEWDCRPYRWGNDETCEFDAPEAGTWHVMVRGYENYANLTLLGEFEYDDGPASCPDGSREYSGSLSGSGDRDIQPNGTYYQSDAGDHSGLLHSLDGAELSLSMFRWNGSSWALTANSSEPDGSQTIEQSANAGFFYWRIESNAGSGDYLFCLDRP